MLLVQGAVFSDEIIQYLITFVRDRTFERGLRDAHVIGGKLLEVGDFINDFSKVRLHQLPVRAPGPARGIVWA